MNAEMSGFAVCVAGVPGVGKTKLLGTLVARRPDARHLVGSSILRSVIAPATTAEFDQWTTERRDLARTRAIQRLREIRAEWRGPLLIDGHFSLRERGTGSLHRVFTPADIEFYDMLILLDAPAEQIWMWRQADPRERKTESIAQIDEHRRFEREQGEEIAQMMNVQFSTIELVDLEERTVELERLLARAGSET